MVYITEKLILNLYKPPTDCNNLLHYISRATASGFLSSLGRIAAILGNVSFGSFISVSKAIPILLTAAILALGGLVSIKLPESRERMM